MPGYITESDRTQEQLYSLQFSNHRLEDFLQLAEQAQQQIQSIITNTENARRQVRESEDNASSDTEDDAEEMAAVPVASANPGTTDPIRMRMDPYEDEEDIRRRTIVLLASMSLASAQNRQRLFVMQREQNIREKISADVGEIDAPRFIALLNSLHIENDDMQFDGFVLSIPESSVTNIGRFRDTLCGLSQTGRTFPISNVDGRIYIHTQNCDVNWKPVFNANRLR